VEVHNYNARSPDISFGCALSYTVPRALPTSLSIAASAGAATLSWSRSGFTLQQALSPAGPWADVPGPVATSPYTVPFSTAGQYYRLRK